MRHLVFRARLLIQRRLGLLRRVIDAGMTSSARRVYDWSLAIKEEAHLSQYSIPQTTTCLTCSKTLSGTHDLPRYDLLDSPDNCSPFASATSKSKSCSRLWSFGIPGSRHSSLVLDALVLREDGRSHVSTGQCASNSLRLGKGSRMNDEGILLLVRQCNDREDRVDNVNCFAEPSDVWRAVQPPPTQVVR